MQMDIRFELKPKQRPKLAEEIATALHTVPCYQKAPSLAYRQAVQRTVPGRAEARDLPPAQPGDDTGGDAQASIQEVRREPEHGQELRGRDPSAERHGAAAGGRHRQEVGRCIHPGRSGRRSGRGHHQARPHGTVTNLLHSGKKGAVAEEPGHPCHNTRLGAKGEGIPGRGAVPGTARLPA